MLSDDVCLVPVGRSSFPEETHFERIGSKFQCEHQLGDDGLSTVCVCCRDQPQSSSLAGVSCAKAAILKFHTIIDTQSSACPVHDQSRTDQCCSTTWRFGASRGPSSSAALFCFGASTKLHCFRGYLDPLSRLDLEFM